jgi:hypothetical protein
MPKVLHIMANPQHGGVESYFAQLCVALQHAGQHQHVVLLEDESLRGILLRGGVALTEIPRNSYNIQTLKAAINEAILCKPGCTRQPIASRAAIISMWAGCAAIRI